MNSEPPIESRVAAAAGFDHTGKGTTKDAQTYRTALCCLTLEVYYRYLAASR